MNEENDDYLDLDLDDLDDDSKDDIEGFTFFVNGDDYTMVDFFKNPWKFIDKNLFHVNWFQVNNRKYGFNDIITLNIIYKKPIRDKFTLHAGIFLLFNLSNPTNFDSRANFALYKNIHAYSMDNIYHLSTEANMDIIEIFQQLQVNGKNDVKLLEAISKDYGDFRLEYCMGLEEDQLKIFKRIHSRSCVHVILNHGYVSVEELDPLQGIIATAVSIATENNTVLSPRLILEGTSNNKEFWLQEVQDLIEGINSTPDMYKQAFLFYYVLYAFTEIGQAYREKLIPIISKIPREVLNFAFSNSHKFREEHDVLREYLVLEGQGNDDQERFVSYWKRGQKGYNANRSYEEIVFNATGAWKRFDEMDW